MKKKNIQQQRILLVVNSIHLCYMLEFEARTSLEKENPRPTCDCTLSPCLMGVKHQSILGHQSRPRV